jgi:hypothetical protein
VYVIVQWGDDEESASERNVSADSTITNIWAMYCGTYRA